MNDNIVKHCLWLVSMTLMVGTIGIPSRGLGGTRCDKTLFPVVTEIDIFSGSTAAVSIKLKLTIQQLGDQICGLGEESGRYHVRWANRDVWIPTWQLRTTAPGQRQRFPDAPNPFAAPVAQSPADELNRQEFARVQAEAGSASANLAKQGSESQQVGVQAAPQQTDTAAKIEQEVQALAQLAAEQPQIDKTAKMEQELQRARAQMAAQQAQIAMTQQEKKWVLAADTLFPEGGYQLSPNGQAAINQYVPRLRNLQNAKVVVYGYTDSRPVGPELQRAGIANNVNLSSRQADAVVAYLRSQGVNPNILAAKGFGDTHPIAPTDTPQGRAQNRRIEIVLEGPGA